MVRLLVVVLCYSFVCVFKVHKNSIFFKSLILVFDSIADSDSGSTSESDSDEDNVQSPVVQGH